MKILLGNFLCCFFLGLSPFGFDNSRLSNSCPALSTDPSSCTANHSQAVLMPGSRASTRATTATTGALASLSLSNTDCAPLLSHGQVLPAPRVTFSAVEPALHQAQHLLSPSESNPNSQDSLQRMLHARPYVSGQFEDDMMEEEMLVSANASAFSLGTATALDSQQQLLHPAKYSGEGNTDPDADGDSKYRSALELMMSKPSVQLVAKWLRETYEEADNYNLSREVLYDMYAVFAKENEQELMNSASFGKLIRAVFPNLQTRRLGVRGQSKYHYNGIRIRSNVYNGSHPGYAMAEMPVASSQGQQPSLQSQMSALSSANVSAVIGAKLQKLLDRSKVMGDETGVSSGSQPALASPTAPTATENSGHMGNAAMQQEGPDAAEVASQMPSLESAIHFPVMNVPELPMLPGDYLQGVNIDRSKVHTLTRDYRDHLTEIIAAVNDRKVETLEATCMHYWSEHVLAEYAELLASPVICRYIADCDVYFYSAVLNTVYGEVMYDIHSEVLMQLQLLAANFGKWVCVAIGSLPAHFQVLKMQVTQAFVNSLQRALMLNTVVAQARPLVINQQCVHQMVPEWKKIDFDTTNEFTSWACQWQYEFLRAVENEMISILKQRATIENWTTWLNSLVQKSVSFPMLHEACDILAIEYNAKQFIGKFSFFTAQLVRDFTIRVVPTFGSWHTLRLFFDEYVWYITIKNLSILKMNHRAKRADFRYPSWVNGVFFYHLELHNFFGTPAMPNIHMGTAPMPSAPAAATNGMSELFRVTSVPRLLMGDGPELAIANSSSYAHTTQSSYPMYAQHQGTYQQGQQHQHFGYPQQPTATISSHYLQQQQQHQSQQQPTISYAMPSSQQPQQPSYVYHYSSTAHTPSGMTMGFGRVSSFENLDGFPGSHQHALTEEFVDGKLQRYTGVHEAHNTGPSSYC